MTLLLNREVSVAWRTLVLLALIAAPEALACRCPPSVPLKPAYERAFAVVVGEVDSVQPLERGTGSTAVVISGQAWKHDMPRRIEVETRTTCAFDFIEGRQYVMFLFKAPAGRYYTSKCVGNLPLADSSKTRLWLEKHGSAAAVR